MADLVEELPQCTSVMAKCRCVKVVHSREENHECHPDLCGGAWTDEGEIISLPLMGLLRMLRGER